MNESNLHWTVYAAAFLAIAVWETWRPLRDLLISNAKRWAAHIAMATLGHATMFLTPITATSVAAIAVQHNPFGLLNHDVLPWPAQAVLGVLLIDFVRWGQHLCFHRIELLWRVHRVHHSDPDYDLTTTLRFHPLEAFLTQITYLIAVYAIAPPAVVVLGTELALLVQNFFGHANVSMPKPLESVVRRFLVTPDMHRIHHSTEYSEQNHNFGTMFPFWDRLFGTFQEEPLAGDARSMTIGLEGYDPARASDVLDMLTHPFRQPEAPQPQSSLMMRSRNQTSTGLELL